MFLGYKLLHLFLTMLRFLEFYVSQQFSLHYFYRYYFFPGNGDSSGMQELDFWKEKTVVGDFMFTPDEDMEYSTAVSWKIIE